jgi:type IV secretion system protein VirD4
MRNYAGHRLAPWLAHVMVSRQETSRPLLTPGEVMQLKASDELVLGSGLAPIRAKKLRYFEDRNFRARLLPPLVLAPGSYVDRPLPRTDDWTGRVAAAPRALEPVAAGDETSGGLQQQRQPGFARRRTRRPDPDQLDLLGLGDDDGDPAVDAQTLGRLHPAYPIIAAHAVNEGAGPDLLPSF